MADISKITLPSNVTYNIKDATARGDLATKQDTLVSGTNIKTINNESILGSGNLTISGGGSLPSQTGHSGDILSTDGTDPYWADTASVTSVSIDTTVTANSSNLVTSGAVSTAISSKTEIFWVTYGTTTNAQIEAAYQANKVILMYYNNLVYQLVQRTSSTSHIFGTVWSGTYYQASIALGSWSNSSKIIPSASTTTPSMDGTASYGNSTSYARSDHVHPTDTSRQAKINTGTITTTTSWSGSGPYTQTVTVSNLPTGVSIGANSKVDLQPDSTAITQLVSDSVKGLYVSNTNGTLTMYAVGAAPSAALTLQVTVTEVTTA